MRKLMAVLAVLALASLLIAVNEHAVAHALGIDTQQSQNYDFVSGVGPMFITLFGFSSLFAGLIHHVNCHQEGCWRIGRHKVDGTPWCNVHHDSARHEISDHHLLEQLLDGVNHQSEVLRMILDELREAKQG